MIPKTVSKTRLFHSKVFRVASNRQPKINIFSSNSGRHQEIRATLGISTFISDATDCYFYRSNVPYHFYDLNALLKLLMIRTISFSILTRITALIFIVGVLAVAIVSIQDTPTSAIGSMTRDSIFQIIVSRRCGSSIS